MSSHSGGLGVKELMWVFVADPPLIDNAIYAMWVDGLAEGLVSQALQSSYPNIESEFVLKHVEDQYKLFVEMRKYLSSPWLFDEHRFMFHVDKQLRNEMLEKYYHFDAGIVREFFGKRLTEKMRPALTDLSNRVGIMAKSTVRQFENIRRIYKWATSVDSHAPSSGEGSLTFADEFSSFGSPSSHSFPDPESRPSISADGVVSHAPTSAGRSQDLVTELMHVFQLPSRLSRKYARIVYAAVNQFELDKKKLQHLKYKDIDRAIGYMIKYWGSLPEDEPRVGSLNITPNILGDTKSDHQDPPNSGRRESKNSSSPRNPSALSISSPAYLDNTGPTSARASASDFDGMANLAHTDGTHSNPPSGSMQFTMMGSSPSNSAPSNWYVTPTDMFPSLAPHPKMVSRLNQIKALVSSHKAELNSFVDEIRKKLGDFKEQEPASAAPDPSRQGKAEALVNYKFLKSFFHLGTAIGQSKDYKKIFTDLLEDIIQPCIDVKLTSAELAELFRLLQIEGQAFISASLGPSPKQSTRKHLGDAWINYITGLSRISQVLGSDKFE